MQIQPVGRTTPATRTTALEAMLEPGMTPAERAEILEVGAAFRPEILEALRADGYRVSYTDRFEATIGGLHDPDRRTVEISRGWETGPRRRAILHELAHAVDSVRYRTGASWLDAHLSLSGHHYASEEDDRLAGLYSDYLVRSAVDDAVVSRDLVLRHAGRTAAEPASLGLVQGTQSYDAVFTPAGTDGVAVLATDRTVPKKWLRRTVLPVAALAAGAVAAGTAALPLAVAGIAWGAARLARGLGELREATRFAESSGDVQRKDGRVLRVDVRDGRQRVEIPAGEAAPEAMWSNWAARARWIPEYFAEGAASYLESPEQRRILEERDPGLFHYMEEQRLGG